MSTLKLEFTIPEERVEAEQAVHAGDYYCALWEIAQEIRRRQKEDQTAAEAKVWETVKEFFYDEINERGISLDA